jgi:hypothetical protein
MLQQEACLLDPQGPAAWQMFCDEVIGWRQDRLCGAECPNRHGNISPPLQLKSPGQSK